jgi:tetratricopeptide (TPR) repeat protein
VAPALGVVATLAASGCSPADRDYRLGAATRLLSAGLAAHPEDVVTRAGLAWLLGLGGAVEDARRHWKTAHAQLGAGLPFPVDRVPLPFGFDRFRVEWEQAAQAPHLDTRMARFRPLLEARAAAGLAALEETAQAPAPDQAIAWLTESVSAWPGIAGNVQRLAERLEAAGDTAAAAAAFARLLERNPFDRQARRAAVRLAGRRGDGDTLARLLDEARRLAAAAPEHADLITDVEALAVPAGSPHP